MNKFVLVNVDTPDAEPSCWPPRIRPSLNIERVMGAPAWRRLPLPVRRRFAAGHGDVRYQGQIDLDCSLAGRVFALLARLVGGPLTSRRAVGLRASVSVSDDQQGGVLWERHFANQDGAGAQVVRSTKLLGSNGKLIEQTDGGLAMELEVFEEHGALVFESKRYFYKVGAVRLAIPALVTPGVCRVEHHDLGAGRFRFTLKMTHPIWGVTFMQDGVFNDPSEITS